MDRMNKTEFLDLVKSLKVEKSEFWVVSSGGLVLRDLLPDAGDLDIVVTPKGFKELKENYELIEKENGTGYIVNDKIECVAVVDKENLPYPLEEVEGFFTQNVLEYYDYLKSSEREKDKNRIPLLEAYLKEKGKI